MAETYTCARCHGTFEKGWSDEEALMEARELFGYDVPQEEREVLCDDCYEEFKKWVETLTPAERAELDRQTLGGPQ